MEADLEARLMGLLKELAVLLDGEEGSYIFSSSGSGGPKNIPPKIICNKLFKLDAHCLLQKANNTQFIEVIHFL